ncbi:MAG: hypothetical protein AB7L90_11115 [Hyphomicrobiaceae bacterium]
MTLVKTFVLACALSIPVTMTQIAVQDAPAQAATKKKAKTAKASKKKVKKVASKSCGEYKFLKGGKCQDARAKAGSSS